MLIKKFGPLAKDEMSFEEFCFVFFSLSLTATLFNGAEPLRRSRFCDQHCLSLFRSRGHPVASEQVLAQNDQMV